MAEQPGDATRPEESLPGKPVLGEPRPEESLPGESLPEESLPGDPVPAQPVPAEPVDEPTLRAVTEIKKPSTIGGLIYLVALAGALVGVVVAASGAWRSGVSWLALSLLVAAGARLALTDDDAGMLRVRRKGLDVTILVVMAVSLLVLVATIPDQPG